MKEYEKVIQIEPQNDAFDDVRMEYAQMLHNQLAKGTMVCLNPSISHLPLRLTIWRWQGPKLERIETDILSNFKVLGVTRLSPEWGGTLESPI